MKGVVLVHDSDDVMGGFQLFPRYSHQTRVARTARSERYSPIDRVFTSTTIKNPVVRCMNSKEANVY